MENDVSKSGIRLSNEAIAATYRLISDSEDYRSKPLRLYLDGKGCDGFYYGVSFDEKQEGDTEFPQDDAITVVVDSDTLDFVQGAVINWVDDERGRGYLVDNPDHNKYRGKFFKRPKWHRLREQRKQERAGVNNDQTPPA